MKKILIVVIILTRSVNALADSGCNGDIQTYINVAESPGGTVDQSFCFLWGKATKLIADHYGCNDNMEEYAGGGNPASCTVKPCSQPGIGGISIGNLLNINGTSYNAFRGVGFGGYDIFEQYLEIDVVAEYVKETVPNIIDAAGRFTIVVKIPIKRNGNGQNTYYEHDIIVWTDYRFNRIGADFTCENTDVDFSMLVSGPAALMTNCTYLPAAPFTPVSGSVYNSGSIGSSLNTTVNFDFNASYIIGTEDMEPAHYPHAGFLVSCFYRYFSNQNPQWIQMSLANLKTLNIDKVYSIDIFNTPSMLMTGSYPSPLYDNDPSFVLESYWSFSGETSHFFSGGGVSYSSGNDQFSFNPNVGNGVHTINITVDNSSKCYFTGTTNIVVTQYPGTPNKPILDYETSFNQHTDSSIITSGCLVPTYVEFPSGNTVVDASMYQRHKWLCPNGIEDSLTLSIFNPNASLTYYWKRSVDGLEEDLGTGTSKKIARQTFPVSNEPFSYVELVYFRSKNVVNNYSPWEYVLMEYPEIPYQINQPNDSLSYLLRDTLCHDGLPTYQLINSLANADAFSGFQVAFPGTIKERRYTYTTMNSTGNLVDNGSVPLTWNGAKTENFIVAERGYYERNLSTCWNLADWCDCDTRTFEVTVIKEPDFTSVVSLVDTAYVGQIVNLNATTSFGGTVEWYIDSLFPPHTGNSPVFYAYGNEGYHDAYLTAVDQYGCSTDTSVFDLFYVKNWDYVIPAPDTIFYTPLNAAVGVCIDFNDGGNLILTPNNDGLNDDVSFCHVIGDFEFIVFDRWGNVVSTTLNQPIVLLDELDSSTYYYLLRTAQADIRGFIELKK